MIKDVVSTLKYSYSFPAAITKGNDYIVSENAYGGTIDVFVKIKKISTGPCELIGFNFKFN